jgi:hypothetical protein
VTDQYRHGALVSIAQQSRTQGQDARALEQMLPEPPVVPQQSAEPTNRSDVDDFAVDDNRDFIEVGLQPGLVGGSISGCIQPANRSVPSPTREQLSEATPAVSVKISVVDQRCSL